MWLAVVVATAGAIWRASLALSRKPDPLLGVGRGLFLVALWSAIGIIDPSAALRAGDSFSTWVLDEAANGQAADRLVVLAGMASIQSSGAVIVLGLLMMPAGFVQFVPRRAGRGSRAGRWRQRPRHPPTGEDQP